MFSPKHRMKIHLVKAPDAKHMHILKSSKIAIPKGKVYSLGLFYFTFKLINVLIYLSKSLFKKLIQGIM
jgi:hypothetical protein